MHKTEKEISAGAVIFKKTKENYQVIIYSRNRNTQWCLPKGKIEPGETAQRAATREVKEETGLEGKIITHLKDIYYTYDDKIRKLHLEKTVHYFLMEFEGGQISTGDPKVETVRWFNLDEAIKKITFDNEKQTLEKAKEYLTKRGF